MKRYSFVVYPHIVQDCTIEAPDGAKVDEEYILDHWDDVQFGDVLQNFFDYDDTPIDAIEEDV